MKPHRDSIGITHRDKTYPVAVASGQDKPLKGLSLPLRTDAVKQSHRDNIRKQKEITVFPQNEYEMLVKSQAEYEDCGGGPRPYQNDVLQAVGKSHEDFDRDVVSALSSPAVPLLPPPSVGSYLPPTTGCFPPPAIGHMAQSFRRGR